MILYALLALAIYVGGNAYVFWHLLQTMSCAPQGLRILFIILFWVAAFALFIALGLRNVELPSSLHRTLHIVGSVWLVFILYMVLTTALFDIVHLIIPTFHGGVMYALCATGLLLFCGYINYRQPDIKHITITTEKLADGEHLRVVAVSDIHLGYGTGREALSKYVKLINGESPDAVVIVGDLIDNSIRPVAEARMEEVLSTINAPLGVYMVPGNHEYISGLAKCDAYLRHTNIHLLRDSIIKLPHNIELICRDDRINQHRKPLEELASEADNESFTIVLDHQPYDIATSNALGIDLHLSGHTHHGQVWPLNIITDLMYDQSHGYRKWSTTHAYVSSGLSLWGPPFRIGTKSDMAVIDIIGTGTTK